MAIGTGPVSLGLKFFLQLQQFYIQIIFKSGDIPAAALAASGFAESQVEILEGAELWIEVFVSFHCCDDLSVRTLSTRGGYKKIEKNGGKPPYPQKNRKTAVSNQDLYQMLLKSCII